MGYIYRITNKLTGKAYIGETGQADPEARWKEHLTAFRKGRGCPALRDAIGKYGVENFRFEVLVICFDEARFEMERFYIKKYNTLVPNGYNILEGGIVGAGFKGKTHTEEVRARLSEINKIRVSDPKYLAEASERGKRQMEKVKAEGIDWGKTVRNSVKFLKAMGERRVGAAGHKDGRHSEESKEKISESLKKHFAKDTKDSHNILNLRKSMAKAVGVKVQKLDLDNNVIATYDSIAEAARSIERRTNTINQCLKGKTARAGGFKWRRVVDNSKGDSKIELI